jgi:hypothetical protein
MQWSSWIKEIIMLQQFTWQQFLIATLVFTFLWYLAIVLIFYRDKFLGLLNGEKTAGQAEPLPHHWEKGVDQLTETENEDDFGLMGKSKLPEGMSRIGSDTLMFMGTDQKDHKMEQVGLVPDVLQELKTVFSSLEKNDGNKKDFLEMMAEVRDKFPKIASSPNIGRINEFIAEHAPFHLHPEELENLWD